MDPKILVQQWVDSHSDELVEFLQSVLRIPSVTGNEGPIQAYLADYLQNMHADKVDSFVPDKEELMKHPAYVHTDAPYDGRPNVVATFNGTGGGRSLLFNGHIDVIPEGAAENWQHDCWAADIEDGKVYARGAADMKSGVAAYTMAIKAIQECGIKLKGDIIAEYVMDEELTGNGTLACVTRGYKADAGICCETSSMCVQPGSIGRIWFRIKVRGKAAGIQRRFEGVNAIDLGYIVNKAVSAFEEIRLKKISHHLYPDIISSIPCMVGQFESGTYASAFPDACVMNGSMATVPGENSNAVKAEFVEFVKKTCAEQNEWLRDNPPEIEFVGYFAEPAETPVDSPIVTCLCENFTDVMKQEPTISGRQGAADIRHLNCYGDTPSVIFGPGMTEQMHANNEWVKIDDYLNAVAILARTIIAWCGTEE